MRMNISLPDGLRQRMQPFDDRANWSAIAAAAFQREVDRLAALNSIEDDVKRRLRQTEMEDAENVEETAKAAGREWARRHARMVHLRRLREAEEVLDRMPQVTQDAVARIALREETARWSDMPGFTGYADGLYYIEDFAVEAGWALAFVEGAMEVLDAL